MQVTHSFLHLKSAAAFAVLFLLFFGACKKDTLVITDIDEYVTITAGDSPKFNVEYKPSAHVDFKIDKKGAAKISEIKVYKQYISAGGVSSDIVLHKTLTSFPAVVNVTLSEALSGLGLNLTDFTFGDKVNFTIVIKSDNKDYDSNLKFEALSTCPSDLAGVYKVVTTYSQHDFLPSNSTMTDTVTIKALEAGKYMVADLSGGLYSKGPYKGAYGTSGINASIEDICNVITWTGVNDPWGAVVPVPGGTNAVDENTGIITISWKCNAYGEQGVSIYTPL